MTSTLTLPCKSNKTDATLTVKHIVSGSSAGTTKFDIHRAGENEMAFSLLNKEQASQLAEYLMEQISSKQYKSSIPTFEVIGYALMVMCDGNHIRTLVSGDDTPDLSKLFSIEAIRKAFPEYSSNEYYFAIYPYRNNISRENSDKIISACLKYQKDVLVSGNLKVCKPMTQITIQDTTGLDNTTISRAIKDARIYTSHRNYSLEIGIQSLGFPSLFDEGISAGDGTIISTLGIKVMMNAIIEMEDKSKPLADKDIKAELERYGYYIERRTVAKYREKALGIPNSNMRRIRQ